MRRTLPRSWTRHPVAVAKLHSVAVMLSKLAPLYLFRVMRMQVMLFIAGYTVRRGTGLLSGSGLHCGLVRRLVHHVQGRRGAVAADGARYGSGVRRPVYCVPARRPAGRDDQSALSARYGAIAEMMTGRVGHIAASTVTASVRSSRWRDGTASRAKFKRQRGLGKPPFRSKIRADVERS